MIEIGHPLRITRCFSSPIVTTGQRFSASISFEVVQRARSAALRGSRPTAAHFTSDEQLARAMVLGLVNNKLHSSLIFFATSRVTQPCMAVKCSGPHSLASKKFRGEPEPAHGLGICWSSSARLVRFKNPQRPLSRVSAPGLVQPTRYPCLLRRPDNQEAATKFCPGSDSSIRLLLSFPPLLACQTVRSTWQFAE